MVFGWRKKSPGPNESANVTVMREVLERARNEAENKSAFMLDPREKHWLAQWDMTMMVALIFVAIVTPYEVSFLKDNGNDALFWVNVVLDCAFLFDMIVQFHMAFQDSAGSWITQLTDIRRHYVLGWFSIDFVSICPFWIIGRYFTAEDAGEAAVLNATDDDTSGSPTAVLRMVRVVRLLRLLKLFRVLKASRILKRFEARMTVTYAELSLCQHVRRPPRAGRTLETISAPLAQPDIPSAPLTRSLSHHAGADPADLRLVAPAGVPVGAAAVL